MPLSEEEITRLHRIRKTVMQMLKDRGYLVGDFEINMSRFQFVDKFGDNMKREDLTINKSMKNDNSDQVRSSSSTLYIIHFLLCYHSSSSWCGFDACSFMSSFLKRQKLV